MLQPKDKLDYLLKMMPYVLPKVENVNGEWNAYITKSVKE